MRSRDPLKVNALLHTPPTARDLIRALIRELERLDADRAAAPNQKVMRRGRRFLGLNEKRPV
jgi:hypothetical protein